VQLVFALARYFPFGGLERDMLCIARVALERGHGVEVLTGQWDGPRCADVPVEELGLSGITNHGRVWDFARRFQRAMESRPDRVAVGFSKIPGLHAYYAADPCFVDRAHRTRPALYRATLRYRSYARLEQAVFSHAADTQILLIAPAERARFQSAHGTPPERFCAVPPGIDRGRIRPCDAEAVRAVVRRALDAGASEPVLLCVGSGFRTKGLDRSIRAFAALAREQPALLWVVGVGDDASYRRLARELGVGERVRFLGGRDDVARLLWSADVLLHPARAENTGTVLLEALVAGLPVVASSVCGYAPYIAAAGMGSVVEEPDDTAELLRALRAVLATDPALWRARGAAFAAHADVFRGAGRVVDALETRWGSS